MADRPLTPKREAFVRALLTNGRNATAAYRTAFDCQRMSPRAIAVEASKLLHHPDIALRIQQATDAVEKRTEVTAGRVRDELARVAFSDPRKLYNSDGTLKPPSEWDDDTAAAVAGMEVFEEFERVGKSKKKVGETRKVKRWDKNRALDSLAKHLGMYGDKLPQSGPQPVVVIYLPERRGAVPQVIDAQPVISLPARNGSPP